MRANTVHNEQKTTSIKLKAIIENMSSIENKRRAENVLKLQQLQQR